MSASVDLHAERAALDDARSAATEKLAKLRELGSLAADEYTEGFIEAVVAQTMEQLQRDLTVFGPLVLRQVRDMGTRVPNAPRPANGCWSSG